MQEKLEKDISTIFCLLGVGNQAQYEELRVSVSCWQLLPICLPPLLLLSHQMILKKGFFHNIPLPLLVIHSQFIWLKNKMFDSKWYYTRLNAKRMWYLRQDHLVFLWFSGAPSLVWPNFCRTLSYILQGLQTTAQ